MQPTAPPRKRRRLAVSPPPPRDAQPDRPLLCALCTKWTTGARNKTVIAASFATHLPFARYTSPATPNLSAFARVLRSSEGK
jgi:hypothetical protein